MPVPLAKKTTEHAGVAQSVEQRTRNAKVAGSIPVSGTNQVFLEGSSGSKHHAKPRLLRGLLFLGVHSGA